MLEQFPQYRIVTSYPNPPTSASFVQIDESRPPEKSSLNTMQYLWCTTEDSPSYTKKPAIPNPNNNPMMGMIVTHFSFGSTFALHGCSTSPFRTLLEWKYLCGRPRTADEEPKDDAGLELNGEEKGLPLGAGEMSSPKGLLLLSGVPGRIGVVAVEMPEMALPLYCALFSILCPPAREEGTQRLRSILNIKADIQDDCEQQSSLQWYCSKTSVEVVLGLVEGDGCLGRARDSAVERQGISVRVWLDNAGLTIE
jgi:hypothetical protein